MPHRPQKRPPNEDKQSVEGTKKSHPRPFISPPSLTHSTDGPSSISKLSVVVEPMVEPIRELTEAELEAAAEAKKTANKLKKEARKKARKEKQMVLHLERVESFKRAQRYLGLRPAAGEEALRALNPSAVMPYPPAEFPVIVSVDVESYERDHSRITEIGIATLDTADLFTVPPGPDGSKWHFKIRPQHFIILEHRHLVNWEFVRGCPDRFEFGKTETIRLCDAPFYLQSAFSCAGLLGTEDSRKVILLGHDVNSDISYLKRLGFDPMPYVWETVDSADLYRTWKQEQNITNLGKILDDFDMRAWHPHNAGNDAYYTVMAMLAVCVREASVRASLDVGEKEEEEKPKEAAPESEEENVII